MVNEQELRSDLGSRGFSVVAPEDLPVSEQIRTFSRARMIIGAHGAGFTNLLFAHNAHIIEFMAAYRNRCYERLAATLGHRYRWLPATPMPHDAMDVDLRLLAEMLDGQRVV